MKINPSDSLSSGMNLLTHLSLEILKAMYIDNNLYCKTKTNTQEQINAGYAVSQAKAMIEEINKNL